METNKYQLDNFVVCIDKHADDTESLVIRNLAGNWRMQYSEEHALFHYWLNVVDVARGSTNARAILEATITMIYQLSNLGVHNPETTNALVDVVDGFQKHIAATIEKVTTQEQKEEESKDDEAWMNSCDTMDEMQEESEK